MTKFPDGFLWGAAANQIEGAYGVGGKRLSIQDVLPHGILTPPGPAVSPPCARAICTRPSARDVARRYCYRGVIASNGAALQGNTP